MARVAIVSASSVPGGAERALATMVARLPDDLRPFALLFQDGPLREWLEAAHCRCVILDPGRTRQIHRTAQTVARIGSLLRREGAEIVVSSQSKSHVYGGLAAVLTRVPGIRWQLGTPEPSRVECAAALVPTAAIVCPSTASVTAQRRLTPRAAIERIPLGIDIEAVARRRGSGTALKRDLGWENARVVGVVGRLQPKKGQKTFLRAAAELIRRHSELRFAVVGGAILGWEGAYPQELEQLAANLGISDVVHFAGHQEDPLPWFDACDVIVQPAEDEGFPVSVLETLALEKPIVAAASGGTLDMIEHGVSGLFVPVRDPESTAAAVDELLDNPELAARLGAAAAARVREFSGERMAAAFADLLRRVLYSRREAVRA